MIKLKVAFNQVGQATCLNVKGRYFRLIFIAIEVAGKSFALHPLHKQIEKHGSMPHSPFPKSDSRAGDTSSEIKRPGCEPDHPHKTSTEFKNKCSYACTSPCLLCVHSDNFTFTFTPTFTFTFTFTSQ
jgi:hypothetical protein